MRNFHLNTDNNDEWLTPPDLISALGVFDLDPCAPINRPWDTAKTHLDKTQDGLKTPWFGRVWLNPPYKWLAKLADHGKGVALIFARTETKGFHEVVWGRAHSVFFFQGRIHFHYVDGRRSDGANAPSCLVAYSPSDTASIEEAWLNGKLVYLRK